MLENVAVHLSVLWRFSFGSFRFLGTVICIYARAVKQFFEWTDNLIISSNLSAFAKTVKVKGSAQGTEGTGGPIRRGATVCGKRIFADILGVECSADVVLATRNNRERRRDSVKAESGCMRKDAESRLACCALFLGIRPWLNRDKLLEVI
jgi:hypothetical protein